MDDPKDGSDAEDLLQANIAKVKEKLDKMPWGKDGPRKVYTVDTNVLIRNPFILYVLSGNEIPASDTSGSGNFADLAMCLERSSKGSPNGIALVSIVEDELDKVKGNKSKQDFTRVCALQALKNLEDITLYGEFAKQTPQEGIHLGNDAVYFEYEFRKDFIPSYVVEPDNDDRIVWTLVRLQKELGEQYTVAFVSDDSRARKKARKLEIPAEPCMYESVEDPKLLFQPPKGVALPRTLYQQLFAGGSLLLKEVCNALGQKTESYSPNEVLHVCDNQQESKNLFAIVQQGNMRRTKYVRSASIKDLFDVRTKDSRFEPISHEELVKQTERYVNAVLTIIEPKLSRKNALNLKNMYHQRLVVASRQPPHMQPEALRNINRDIRSLSNARRYKRRVKGISAPHYLFFERQTSQDRFDYSSDGASRENSHGSPIHMPFNPNIVLTPLQQVYMDLLVDPTIDVVSAHGPQGTGKTLCAVLGGLIVIANKKYARIWYMRHMTVMGPEMGALPGTERKKFRPWAEAAIDNLQEIFNYNDVNASLSTREHIDAYLDELEDHGIIAYKPPNFIPGRSIHNTYWIIDEAHNLTSEEIKMLLGRGGKGTKIVIMGDPNQIITSGKSRFLTIANNGLSHVNEKFRGKANYACITFPETDVMRGPGAEMSLLL